MLENCLSILRTLHGTGGFWLVELGLLFVATALVSFSLHCVIKYFHKHFAAQPDHDKGWEGRLEYIFSAPLQLALWGAAFLYAIDIGADRIGYEEASIVSVKLLKAFVVVCFGWVILRWIKVGFNILAQKSQAFGVAQGTLLSIYKLIFFVEALFVLLTVFHIFGFNVLPFLTFGGIGVAGIAFAAQDIIANFFGGVMLHLTRPFLIGDNVVIPSQNNFQGTVEEIGWYTSVIRDVEKQPTYFPNALFSKMNVINMSRRTHQRILEKFYLRYEDVDKVEAITKSLREELGELETIDGAHPLCVALDTFGDFGIKILIQAMTTATSYPDFLQVKQVVLKKASAVVHKYGAAFAYPTTQVIHANIPLQSTK